MTRLIFSTSRRHTNFPEPTGYIYLLDVEKDTLLQQSQIIEPAFRELDPNPRGGMRGMRGISICVDQIAIANAAVVYRYDRRWNLLGITSHPSMMGIHDVLLQSDTLWATSTRNDLLFQFDLAGNLRNYYYMHDPSPATRALKWKPERLLKPEMITSGQIEFRDPLTHEERTYDKAHLNSICILPDGEILISLGLVVGSKFSTLLWVKNRLVKAGLWSHLLTLNRRIRQMLHMKKNPHSDLVVKPAQARSAVVELHPDGAHRLALALEAATVPSHSLLPHPDGLSVIYLNTTAGEVVHFNPQDGKIYSSTRVTDGFLRGAAWLPDGRLVLGSRNFLLTFDLDSRRLISTRQISDDKNESLYDIQVLPEDFDAPPLSFEMNFLQATGFPSLELPQREYRLPVPPGAGVPASNPPAEAEVKPA
jgi:hypothetical protein